METLTLKLKVFFFYLEDMEGLKLDVGTLVSQQIHHQLEILGLADVARHHREVMSVQQELAQKLEESDMRRRNDQDRARGLLGNRVL